MRAVVLLVVMVLPACGYEALPQLSSGDASAADATADAPTELTITVSTSTFVLHVNDTRDPVFTITNYTGQPVGTPALQVTGLTLGTMTFPAASNTCTANLGPGESCKAVGHLTATSAGEVGFEVTATASPGGTVMAALAMTAMPACLANCGANAATNCCASAVVPGNAMGAGLYPEPFYRSYDGTTDYNNAGFPATVSDYRLDTYEVTVGRFRAFVDAGMGTQASPPASGAGAHAKISGSGWDTSWNASLAADTATLKANVKCDSTHQTWTDTAGANENLPMNCITWYEAFAFCIWDGGYLPTEAEWNYAASGGSEQRAYPWSAGSSTTIDCSFANYKINLDNYCTNGTTGAVSRVGSKSPKGDGKFGQSDLAGNVREWNLDWYDDTYLATCNDCMNPTGFASVLRGGAFETGAGDLRAAARGYGYPAVRYVGTGVRCARTP